MARISATTAIEHGAKLIQGFETTANKGAGIRVYEYASDESIEACRVQLEALFWLCNDSADVANANRMTYDDALSRKNGILSIADKNGLLDYHRLVTSRILSADHHTTCPLCLQELSSNGFFSRLEQAEGREVLDLTVTQINLFHIEELRMGGFNHRPYNLGWGHHHCNLVVKDAGILPTLRWMSEVIKRNMDQGHLRDSANNPI